MKANRVFLIVLDSFGIGALPDAARFGDGDVNTLRSCFETGQLSLPNMSELGLFNIDGVTVGSRTKAPVGAYCRLREASNGKDTTIGHWEIAGIISESPLPTYPDGFPQEILDELRAATGREILCNKPYSGTAVIADYGAEHLKTGALIVYTSADSVLQIAAHEDIVPVEELYECCAKARKIMTGEHGVGRIIARPFSGEYPFARTSGRHDFSLVPPKKTMLDFISGAGRDVIAIGKISDIFAGAGITSSTRTSGNAEGITLLRDCIEKDFRGLCFVNLVDYDMLYGHRRNPVGYAEALNYFDTSLGEILPRLKNGDVLMITADHGCDPAAAGTDHTREYTPLLVYGTELPPRNMGTRDTFADIAATVCSLLDVNTDIDGTPLPL